MAHLKVVVTNDETADSVLPEHDRSTQAQSTQAQSTQAQSSGAPSRAQRAWLRRGVDQPGGKLPLFDENGKRIDARTIRRCLEAGWAEPWFSNPIKPDWLVCKLTDDGRRLAGKR